jgi:hypothetical protein
MDLCLVSCNVECYPWSSISIRQKVAELIHQNEIIALQGVWCRHSEWVAAFSEHGWTLVRPARESQFVSIFGSGLAVAFSGRWRLLDSRLYPFLSGTDFPGIKGWFRVDLENVARGYPLRLLNASCQQALLGGEEIRMAQGQQLTQTEGENIDQIPTLLTGEFCTDENWFRGFRKTVTGCLYPARQAWIIQESLTKNQGWRCRLI